VTLLRLRGLRNSSVILKKVKVAHTRLPNVGLQLPSQPLRGLLPVSLLGEQRHDRCEQFAQDCYPTASRLRFEPGPSAPESSTLTTRLPSHPSAILAALKICIDTDVVAFCWHKSVSRDRPAGYAESDTEVDYSRRLNARSSASPSSRSEVSRARSRTLQRPTHSTAAAAAAAAAAAGGDVDGGVRHYHRRQTSLPHSSSTGLCAPLLTVLS